MRGRLRKSLILLAVLALALTATPTAGAQTLEDDIEVSVEAGLHWLAGQQNLDGSFGTFETFGHTGLAILKFEDRAMDLGVDPLSPEYEYSPLVQAGLDYLEANATSVAEGIHWGCCGHEVYSTGIAMMALAASGHPELYGTMLQGAVDWVVWAQADPDCGIHRGGWRYAPNSCTSDNSNAGYATLGLGFASAAPPFGFGLTIPTATLDELSLWIDVIQDPVDGDPWDGGSHYDPDWAGWVNILKTGNLLYEMGLVGDTADTPRVQDAVDYIERHWTDPGFCEVGWENHRQAMFTMMKGLESLGIEFLDLDDDGVAETEWFPIVAQHLIDTQNADGSWPDDCWGGQILSTSWALLTLEKAVPSFEIEVPVDVHPTSCLNPFNVGQGGVTPVAVLGTADFDVTQIDPASVVLEGVAPLRWAYEDVATPFEPFIGRVDAYDCTTEGPDGFLDLSLKYKSQELALAIGDVEDGDVLVLTLTGALLEEFGGTPIIGEDVIVILKK
ncbi:MAG: hypothetical protein ABFR53_06960 [Actinomycetota bacterium]